MVGSPAAISGPVGEALYLHGDGDRVLIADDASLDVQSLTIAAWLQPQERATQYAISKATKNGEDGFELSLSSRGPVFVRFNQDSSGNDYRVESDRSYPTDGTTWMHVAATYDGSTIKLYLDGQLEASKAASFPLATNQLALSLGAQHDGTRPFLGGMDDVRIYSRALDAQEIAVLHQPEVTTSPDLELIDGRYRCTGLSTSTADASGVLQRCVNQTPTGATLELPAGEHQIGDQITVDRRITVTSVGKNLDDPVCDEANGDCAVLVATSELNQSGGIFLATASRRFIISCLMGISPDGAEPPHTTSARRTRTTHTDLTPRLQATMCRLLVMSSKTRCAERD